jgi:hypothetical protein
MPNRWLRDSILASRTLAELSDFAERLFFRLLVVSDDYGRFNSDPAIVRSVCFPLLTQSIKSVRIEKALDELIRSGIARFYLTEGKVIGELINFTRFQRPRAKKSKFLEPGHQFLRTFENIREQMRACETQEGHGRASTDRYRDRTSNPDSDLDLVAEQFEQFYEAYPRRQAKQDAEEAWRKLNPNEQLFLRILADIRNRFRAIDPNFIPLPAKYLSGARWNDEIIANEARDETSTDISKRLIREAKEEDDAKNRGPQSGGNADSRLSILETERGNSTALRRIY